jgi:hypothetical protein
MEEQQHVMMSAFVVESMCSPKNEANEQPQGNFVSTMKIRYLWLLTAYSCR